MEGQWACQLDGWCGNGVSIGARIVDMAGLFIVTYCYMES